MTITQTMIDQIPPEHKIEFWPRQNRAASNWASVVDMLPYMEAQFESASFSSWVNILFFYQPNMNDVEKSYFLALCSYFSGSSQISQWRKSQNGKILFLVFDLKIFSSLLRKSWSAFSTRQNLQKSSSVAEILHFLGSQEDKNESVIVKMMGL